MLTFNELAAVLAKQTGCSIADAEIFLRELFALASEEIESEGGVDVPCLGSFSVVDGAIIYRPDSELAGEINAPFADFEPVELPAGFALEEPSELSEFSENSDVSEVSENSEPSEISECSEPSDSLPEPPAIPLAPEPQEPAERRRGISWWWIVLIALLCFAVGFFFGQYRIPEPVNPS